MLGQGEQRNAMGSGAWRRGGAVVAVVGVGCTLFSLLFGIGLPVFVPPLLRWSGYGVLWKPVAVGFVVGPWLIVCGWYARGMWTAQQGKSALHTVLGCQVLLLALLWLGRDIFLLQKVGWLAFLQVPQWKFPFYGLWGGAPLLALGLSLLRQGTWRDHIGMTLATAGYTALIFLGLYIAFVLMSPQFMVILNPAAFQMPKTGLVWAGISLVTGVTGTLWMSASLRLRFHLLLTCPLWLPFFVVFFFWSLLIHTTFYFLEELLGWEWQIPAPVAFLAQSWLLLVLLPGGVVVGGLAWQTSQPSLFLWWPGLWPVGVFVMMAGAGWGLLRWWQGRQRTEPQAWWEPWALIAVSVLALLLFPVLLTIDFCIGLMGFLGQNALQRFFPVTETSEQNQNPLSPFWLYFVGGALLLTAPLWLLPSAVFWGVRLFVYESLLQPLFEGSSSSTEKQEGEASNRT